MIDKAADTKKIAYTKQEHSNPGHIQEHSGHVYSEPIQEHSGHIYSEPIQEHFEHKHSSHGHGHRHGPGPGCTCKECTSSECADNAGTSNPSVTSYLQDDAVVVSAQYTATANPEAFGHLLTQYMEELAAQLSQEGGIIGHIKASVEVSHIEMYSITDTKVMKKSSRDTLLKLHLAAIVFAVSQDHAIDLVKMLFTRLESCLGDPL